MGPLKGYKSALGSVLVVGVAFASWVGYPPSRYEPQLQTVVERHRQKLLSDQRIANDPAQNAYLHPRLRPYWGTQGDPEDSEAGRQFKSIEAETKAAFQEFRDFYSCFHDAMKKPHFVVPDGQPLQAEAWRRADLALPRYAYSLLEQGQVDEALSVGEDLLRRGSIRGILQDSLDSLSMVLQSRVLTQETLAWLLQSAGLQASQAQLESLAVTLEQTQFPPEALVEAMEGELSDRVKGHSKPSPNDSQLPGVQQREWRMFKNDFMICLEQIRSKEAPLPSPGSEQWRDWLLGRHGHDYWKMPTRLKDYQDKLELSARRQAFLHLYVVLLTYHKKSGQWPVDLEELQSEGFQALAGLNLKQVSYDALGVNLQVSVAGDSPWNGSVPEATEEKRSDPFNKQKWVFTQPGHDSVR